MDDNCKKIKYNPRLYALNQKFFTAYIFIVNTCYMTTLYKTITSIRFTCDIYLSSCKLIYQFMNYRLYEQ